MKKRAAVWDPLANVGKVVDSFLDAPSQQMRKTTRRRPQKGVKSKGGRPRAEGRLRIVLYLNEGQVYNLKKHALDTKKDVSTIARQVFKKAGF